MKRLSTFAASFAFALVFVVSASAQGGAQPATQPTVTKIGWIDTGAFADEKEGVVKYLAALRALDNEMKPTVTALQTLQTRIQVLQADLAKPVPAGVPVDQKAILAKQDEGQSLQREFEFKKKDYDAKIEKRSGEVLGPVSAEISKAIQDFAKQKGYAVILDIDKLGQAGVILALDQTANITKEFVVYFNSRPATTATTATPRP